MKVCPSCDNEYLKSSMDRKGEYFLTTPLKNQILEIIESKTFEKYRKIDPKVNDVINSKLYKYLQKKKVIGPNDISLIWNTDGISLFKSSKKSTWSILARIIELPYKISKENIILNAVWHDKRKPIMDMFLKPFSDELIDLYNIGIECKPYGSNDIINIKVHAILCSVDTVARPTIQNLIQFNGEFGCPYCLQKGEILDGPGNARVYCKCNSENRTKELHEEHVRLALKECKPVKGVKGPSAMNDVPNMDTLHCYPPEYMHAWLLGVAKMIIKAWFDSTNHEKPWYLGTKLDEFNRRLLSILPPCEITRAPQNIENKLKAAELKNASIYYSAVVLLDILPIKYYRHWLLFVQSMYIFLKEVTSKEESAFAEKCLISFHDGIEELYGKEFMTFNVHTLKHVTKYKKYFGSLWAWSTFCFESYNGVIKNLFHGTQCIAEQIFKGYFRLKLIKKERVVFERVGCSEVGRSLFIKFMNECRIKNCLKYDDELRLFCCSRYQLSVIEQNLLEIRFEDIVVNIIKCDRFSYKGILFHSRSYHRLQRRNNSCYISKENRIFTIDKIIKLRLESSGDEKIVVIANKIEVINRRLCSSVENPKFVFVGKQKLDLTILEISSIKQKCVVMPYRKDKVAVIPVVNFVETD